MIIVTTSINPPTPQFFSLFNLAKQRGDWKILMVGDTKTPHELYKNLNCWCFEYLSPEYQEQKYKKLSDVLGWRTIQRRNVGFVEAYKYRGSEHRIVSSYDDDQYVYDSWGQNVEVGKTKEVDIWDNISVPCFDPLSVTNNNDLWQRGYPIQWVKEKNKVEYKGKQVRKILAQNDLVDGDADIDATIRLIKKPIVKFNNIDIFGSSQVSPFNSQNLFLDINTLPYYFCFPFVGRFDDIWGGYIFQKYFPNSLVFGAASVYQDRNPQDLITNLENEIFGYRNTINLIQDLDNYKGYLPERSLDAFRIYQESF